ncbi:MAG: hypothetical protein EHM41_12370 [Chloroflexi bacterium]|nr:MAG: hypothetical protein EHM41_12370 [Chloroflexota bacterium]
MQASVVTLLLSSYFMMMQLTFALYGGAVLFRNYTPQMAQLGIRLMLGVVGLGQFASQAWLIRPLKALFGDARLVILGTTLRALGMG